MTIQHHIALYLYESETGRYEQGFPDEETLQKYYAKALPFLKIIIKHGVEEPDLFEQIGTILDLDFEELKKEGWGGDVAKLGDVMPKFIPHNKPLWWYDLLIQKFKPDMKVRKMIADMVHGDLYNRWDIQLESGENAYEK